MKKYERGRENGGKCKRERKYGERKGTKGTKKKENKKMGNKKGKINAKYGRINAKKAKKRESKTSVVKGEKIIFRKGEINIILDQNKDLM